MPVIFVYLLYTVCTKTCKSYHVDAGFTTLIVAICKHYDLSVLFYLYYKEKIYELRQFEKNIAKGQLNMNMTSREFYKMLSLTLSGGNTISCFFCSGESCTQCSSGCSKGECSNSSCSNGNYSLGSCATCMIVSLL